MKMEEKFIKIRKSRNLQEIQDYPGGLLRNRMKKIIDPQEIFYFRNNSNANNIHGQFVSLTSLNLSSPGDYLIFNLFLLS